MRGGTVKQMLCMLAAAAASVLSAADFPRAVLELGGTWLVKPAESPEKLPDDGDWGRAKAVLAQKFRDNIDSSGTSWKDRPRREIHRLWYRTSPDIPVEWKGRVTLLELDRIDGDAIVFVNGRRIGEVLNPTGTIRLGGLKPGKRNVIDIYLARDYFGISRPFEKDYMNYAARGPLGRNLPMERWPFGITAPARLRSVPADVRIDGAAVVTSVRDRKLTLNLELESDAARSVFAGAEILTPEGKTAFRIPDRELSLKSGKNEAALSSTWRNPRLWELEDGYCYTAVVTLKTKDGRLLDRLEPFRFGFREIGTDGNRVLLNGHPVRFRMHSVGNDSLDRMLGVNTIEVQPNATMFYCDWFTWSYYTHEWLDGLDDRGIFCLLPVPSVSNARNSFLSSEPMRREYERQVKLWLKRYRNHPSIIAWVPSMNVVTSRANIHADGMGDPSKLGSSEVATMVKLALELLKREDPTRLTFGHGDGALGDIASSNLYLNFVPLQEREEWPSDWAKKNQMPYMAVEFGQPCTINYWKGPRFLLTEYMAMYLGQRAYSSESPEGLARIVPAPVKNMYNNWFQVDVRHYPAFYEFEGLFMRNTNRAWRAWGVTGWYNWDFDIGFGLPPGVKPRMFGFYRNMKEVFPHRPAWVTPRFDYVAETSAPLLAYIAGFPAHTEKSHSFFSGETVKKQVAVVWDGPGVREVKIAWRALSGGKTFAKGAEALTLNPGDIRFIPFSFEVPQVAGRTEGAVEMRLSGAGVADVTDRLPLEFRPASRLPAKGVKIQLLDPRGKSRPWLEKLGAECVPLAEGTKPDPALPLVIGREALSELRKLPFAPADVEAGLRVLFLEQQPADWELLGFRSIETMPRYVFPRSFSEPLFDGMAQADFINWRGTPDLLPEKKWARSYDFYRAPKWTNTHAIASVALETPGVTGFESLAGCEFDLAYSALLRIRHGKGAIWYSTFEFTANAGSDPAAMEFAVRLLKEVGKTSGETKPLSAAGLDAAQKEIAAALQLGSAAWSPEVAAGSIAVAGREADLPALRKYAAKGGTVFVLPMTAELAKKRGIDTRRRDLYKLEPDTSSALTLSVTPDLLRWRDRLDTALIVGFGGKAPGNGIEVIWDGAAVVEPVGRGKLVYCQLDPFQLRTRYPKSSDNGKKVWPSVEKGFRLYAQLLNALGAGADAAVAKRACTLMRGVTYSNLNGWNVCGPFHFPGVREDRLIYEKGEAEADAIAGRALSDITYYLKDGRSLNWRDTVSADDSGYIDLQKALAVEKPAVAYLTRKITCGAARRGTLRLGMDFYMEVYLNGKLVFDAKKGGGCAPKVNSHRFVIELEKGDNILTVKLASGSKGFGFYANLSNEAETSEVQDAGEKVNFYPEKDTSYDPYQFGYY